VSCLTRVDRLIIGVLQTPHVAVQTVTGAGHLCLDPASDQARGAVAAFAAAHLLARSP